MFRLVLATLAAASLFGAAGAAPMDTVAIATPASQITSNTTAIDVSVGAPCGGTVEFKIIVIGAGGVPMVVAEQSAYVSGSGTVQFGAMFNSGQTYVIKAKVVGGSSDSIEVTVP